MTNNENIDKTGMLLTTGSITGNISNMNELTFAQNTYKTGLKTYVGDLSTGTTVFHEPFMVSKTYFMLREVVLTYNFPKKLLGNSFIKRATFSLVGRNLLYFTSSRKDLYLDQYSVGFDVSKIGVTKNQSNQGNSFGGNNQNLVMNADMQTPVVRSFGCNLNVVF